MKSKLVRSILAASILCATALSIGTVVRVIAQTVVQTDLSGSEAWNCGQGPGAPTLGFCTSNLIRGGTAVINATPIATFTGAFTIGSGVMAPLLNGGNILYNAQPAISAVTLTTMAAPADGAEIGICNVTGSNFATTQIAVVANTGQTMNNQVSTTTLAANTCQRIQFTRNSATWFRIQ